MVCPTDTIISGSNSSAPDAVIAKPTYFESMGEESLARRYVRRNKNAEEVVFEFTRDPGMIHQCFGSNGIYERENRLLINDMAAFRASEAEYNSKSHVLIARVGNFCVGGARLTVSSPRKPQRLPMENNEFRVQSHFEKLKNNELAYAEMSGLVLLEEYRTGEFTRNILMHSYRKAEALGVYVCFAAAPLINGRLYKKCFSSLGLQDMKIYDNVRIPAYPGFVEESDSSKDHLLSLIIDRKIELKDNIASSLSNKEEA